MRDEFGEIDPLEREPDSNRTTPRLRQWMAAGVALGGLVVAAGLALWQLRDDPSATTVPTVGAALALTDQLVIDDPGSFGVSLSFSVVPGAGPAGAEGLHQQGRGYVFAAPGANIDTGPLLAFIVSDVELDEQIDVSGDTVDVNGKVAQVEANDTSIEIYWQAEPGVRYGVAGEGLSLERIVAFAEAVRLEKGATVVSDDSVLDGLEPVGDLTTFFDVIQLASAVDTGAFLPMVRATGVAYEGPASLVAAGSLPAVDDPMRLVALMLPGARKVEVRGLPALIGAAGSDLLNDGTRMIAWAEGGRLVVVAASDPDEARLIAIAESVRPATADDEWAAVLDVLDENDVNLGVGGG